MHLFDPVKVILPPVHPHLLQERCNLFVILTIGEAFAGNRFKDTSLLRALDYSEIVLGITMTLLTKFLMLDLIEEPNYGNAEDEGSGIPRHALITSPRRSGAYLLCFLPLSLGTLLNAGALHRSEHDYISINSRWTFAIGVFLICLGTTGMQLSHKGAEGGGLRVGKFTRTLIRAALSCCTLLLAALPWPTDLTQWVAEADEHSKDQLFDAGRVFLLCEVCLVLAILLFDRYSRTAKSDKQWQSNPLDKHNDNSKTDERDKLSLTLQSSHGGSRVGGKRADTSMSFGGRSVRSLQLDGMQ